MTIGFYVVYSVVLLPLLYFLFVHKNNSKIHKVARYLAVALVIVAFIDIFLPDLFSMRGLPGDRTYTIEKYGEETFNVLPAAEFGNYRNVFHAIVRAGFAIGAVSIPFAIFYKKPYINKVVTYIVLPFSILNTIMYFQYIGYFVSPDAPSVFGEASRVILQNVVFRTVWFGIFNLIQTLLAFYVTIKNPEDLKFKNSKEIGIFAAVALGFIFTNMPIYTAQHLFNTYSEVILTIGYSGHLLFILGIVIEGVALYYIFRNQSQENKYILLFVMALSLLFQYNTFFKTDGVINASRWPFQLCNIAGAFLIITLLTRNERMFHFTLVVNSLGAFIAIAICDSTFNTGIFYEMNIHYMVEHVNVLLTPLLAGLLRVFKPLKKKDVVDVLIGFCGYWVLVLIAGTILCTEYVKTGDEFFEGVNFLFMFNEEKSANLLGFVRPLFQMNFSIGHATFYLVQPLVLLAFLALCTGVFFILYSFLKEKKICNEK